MSRRILLITPYAPSQVSPHGLPRAVRGLAGELARRHEVVIVHLEPDREIDAVLATSAVAVRGFQTPGLKPWRRRVLDAGAILRGQTFWAAELGVGHLRRHVRSLLRDWPADVVQVEHGVLGDVLAAAVHPALRVVTMHETAASMREFLPLRGHALPLTQSCDVVSARRQERRVLRLADVAVAFSDRDRNWLARQRQAEVVTVPLGWGVPAVPLDPLGSSPPTVLFVGNFSHPPNLDAALWLAGVIFPQVRRACPDAVLKIIGPSPPAELRALDSGEIAVTGEVPSVVPHLDRAAVVVVPVRLGGGVRVKVLEALSAGKAVVATPRGVEGIAARPGHELLVAERDDELAAEIVGLLNNPPRRVALGGRARDWAERELSWTSMADRYERLYESLGSRRRDLHRGGG